MYKIGYELEEGLLKQLDEIQIDDTTENGDNLYCETAMEFFEELFKLLQPETEKEVPIYNNRRFLQNDLHKCANR